MKLQELAQLLNFTWIKIKDCVKASCSSKAYKQFRNHVNFSNIILHLNRVNIKEYNTKT